jgi:hypothetical protein
MATEQQIAANRPNALRSSDARSNAGKEVSQMNALRRGLTGQLEATSREEKEAAQKARNVLATRSSCGRRASAIDNNIFTLALREQAPKKPVSSPNSMKWKARPATPQLASRTQMGSGFQMLKTAKHADTPIGKHPSGAPHEQLDRLKRTF